MGRIRPFVEADIPAVAALRLATFRLTRRQAAGDLAAYIRSVFLENPWYDEGLPSLVYENGRGQVAGFVGVIPRRMVFQGAPIRVVVSTQFMVDPAERGAAGVQLVQKLFAGPQDLTIGDAAPDLARKIWVGLGGDTARLHSLFWTKPLRPFRFASSALGHRPLARAIRFSARPVLNALDGVAALAARGGWRRLATLGSLEPLDAGRLDVVGPAVLGWRALHATYDGPSFEWLLARVGEIPHLGPLQALVVRDPAGVVAGWFLYFANPGGIAQVMQVAATERGAPLVVARLFHHARAGGAVGLAGRLDPPLLGALSDAGSRLDRRGPWVLVRSRRQDIARAIARGDAWITSLDGERWLSF